MLLTWTDVSAEQDISEEEELALRLAQVASTWAQMSVPSAPSTADHSKMCVSACQATLESLPMDHASDHAQETHSFFQMDDAEPAESTRPTIQFEEFVHALTDSSLILTVESA